MDWLSFAAFWLLALLPGVLHPMVLYIYLGRCRTRAALITSWINLRTESAGQDATKHEMEDAKHRLKNLNVPSYVYPTVVCGFVSAAAGIVVMTLHDPHNLLHLSAGIRELILTTQMAIVAGFAGAYMWGMYDFVDRFRTLNLSPSALHLTWFRLLLGPVMGYYLQFILRTDWNPFVAFAIGAIPVPDIAMWVRDRAQKTLSISPPQPAEAKWNVLQGLTGDMISRLVEADVSSVTHLAYQNPFRLLQRTNIEWRNVLDMMDQACLWVYIGDKLADVRARGVRGAIEMAAIYGRWKDDQDPQRKQDAAALIDDLAAVLGVSPVAVRNLSRNLHYDSQVDLLNTLWFEDAENHEGHEPPVKQAPTALSTSA